MGGEISSENGNERDWHAPPDRHSDNYQPAQPSTSYIKDVSRQCLPRLRHMLPSSAWMETKERGTKEGGGGYLDAGEAERLVRFEFCIKHQCVDSTYTSPPPMSASPQFHLYWIYNRGRHAIECNCAGSSA